MVFIFCGSYLNVVGTMTAIEREGDDYLVLSSDPSIVKLFAELYSPQNVFLVPETTITFSKPLEIFGKVIRIQRKKKEILPTLLGYNPDKVIFFFTGFDGLALWLIHKLSPIAQVYYKPEIDPQCMRKSRNLRLGIKVLFYTLIYRVSFAQKRISGYCFGGVSDRYLRNVKAKEYPASFNMKYAKSFFERQYPRLPEVKIIMLLGGETNIDNTYYYEQISKFLKRLEGIVRSEEIGIKIHPRSDISNIGIPSGCVVLPKYLPASLLLFKCRIVIGYMSAALYEAADGGRKAISLLEMQEPTSRKQALEYKDYMMSNIKGNGKIYFPSTVDGLLNEVENEFFKEDISCSAKQ